MLYNLFNQQHLAETNISYTEFLSMVEDERVNEVVIQGQEIYINDVNRNRYKTYSPPDTDLIPTLRKKGVRVDILEDADGVQLYAKYRSEKPDLDLEDWKGLAAVVGKPS